MAFMNGDVTQTGTPAADAVADGPPIIPWQLKPRRVTMTAYWRTVFLVLRRNGRLGEFMAGPVDYRCARSFRWITLAHTLALPGAALLVWLFVYVAQLRGDAETAAIGLLIRTGVSVVLLPLITGVASWFFCPAHYDTTRQNRSIALSYYTCAPLAIWALLVPVIAAAGLAVNFMENPAPAGWIVVCSIGVVELWWFQLVLFALADVARRNAAEVLVTALLLPAAILLAVVLLAMVPAMVGLLALMWQSLGP